MKKIIKLLILSLTFNNINSMQNTEIEEDKVCFMPNEIILNIFEKFGGFDLDNFTYNSKFNINDFKSLGLVCKNFYSIFNFIKEKVNYKKAILEKKEAEYLEILSRERILDTDLDNMISLLNFGINPNLKSKNKFKNTILMHAASLNNLNLVKLLVNKLKADLNIKNINLNSALNNAIARGNINIVRFLINSGINLDDKNEFGFTPLKFAEMIKNQNKSISGIDKNDYLNNINEIIEILKTASK